MRLHILSPLVIVCMLAGFAVGADEKPANRPLPEQFKGFDGTLGGKVVSVEPDGTAFVMKVTDVLHVNTRSTAKAPKSVMGREVTVFPETVKGKEGKTWRREGHTNFIQTLKAGQDVQVDCASHDGRRLEINMLTTSQREAAERQKDREEKGSQKREK